MSLRQWTVRSGVSSLPFVGKALYTQIRSSPIRRLVPNLAPQMGMSPQQPSSNVGLPLPMVSVPHLNMPASAPLKRSELADENVLMANTDDELRKEEANIFAEFEDQRDPDDEFGSLYW